MSQDNDNRGIPFLGTPQKLKNYEHVYGIKRPGVIGQVYQTKCPECGGTVVIMPADTKPLKTKCIYCKAVIVSRAITREEAAQAVTRPMPMAQPKPVGTAQQPVDDSPKPTVKTATKTVKVKMPKGLEGKAKLVWGGFFSRKKYVLHMGANTIGRQDDERPSDLMFDDEYMSRQSVRIDVQKASKGHFYKLTVLKTANPVVVNGEELKEGESVYINYGDTIALGYNTFLTFKSD